MKSVEDHGYILNIGVTDVTAFLSFKDAQKRFERKLSAGFPLDVLVVKVSQNGRTCDVSVEETSLRTASVSGHLQSDCIPNI